MIEIIFLLAAIANIGSFIFELHKLIKSNKENGKGWKKKSQR